MDKDFFKEAMLNEGLKPKGIKTRISKANKAIKILNQDFDSIIKNDDMMYEALIALQEHDSVNQALQNALRKYYFYKKKKEFPRLSQFKFEENYEGELSSGLKFTDYLIENHIYNTEHKLEYNKLANQLKEQELIENHLKDRIKDFKIVSLTEINIPVLDGIKKYVEMTERTPKKIDYIKRQEQDIAMGYLGECMVVENEREKLKKLGRPDLADQVEMKSLLDDSLGYDITSYKIDDYGKSTKIYIEVKTTSLDKNTPFYITQKEIKTYEELKEQYYIYRVVTKDNTFFKINYQEFNTKFEINPITFIAKLK